MKKRILAICIAATTFFLMGCGNGDVKIETSSKESLSIVEYINSRISLYKDNETGVHYIINYEGGMTPRLNADGTLYVD